MFGLGGALASCAHPIDPPMYYWLELDLWVILMGSVPFFF